MPKTLQPNDIADAAQAYQVEAPKLAAVTRVESGGSGFLPDGRLKILFEGHWLWRRLQARGISPLRIHLARPDLCFAAWTRAFYKGGAREWDRVDAVTAWAQKAEPARWESYKKAALESCSYGLFQEMGFHFAESGFADIYAMKHAFEVSERYHLYAILRWMQGAAILPLLRAGQWDAFARRYNGDGQVRAYSDRLRAEYWRRK